jgi:hypothetical protein
MLLAALLVGGLFLVSTGCTTMVSDDRPAPQPQPQPRAHPPGHAWGWDRGRPRMEVIQGTSIQFVVEGNEDIFLCGGSWYRWGGGVWFMAHEEGGAWQRIQEPPAVFYRIPPGHVKYRVVKDHNDNQGKGRDKDKDDDDRPGKGHGRNKD